MTHAWLFTGPAGSGRSVAARAFAAALQCERDAAPAAASARPATRSPTRSHPDVHSVVPEGLSIAVAEMRAVVGAVGPPSGARALAGRRHRGRRPAHRAGVQRAAQGGRGTARAHRVPAVRAVAAPRRRVADDPVAVPAGLAAHAAGRGGRARCCERDGDRRRRRADWAAAAGAGPRRPGAPAGPRRRGPRAARRRCWRSRRRSPRCGACLDAADQLVERGRGRGERRCPATLDADETEALQVALGAGGTGKGTAATDPRHGRRAADLEKRQKSRATRTQRDALDRALVDLAAFYRDVLLVHDRLADRAARIPTSTTTCARWPCRLRSARRAAPPRRRARLPRGARAQRQAAHRRRGDDRRAAPALTREAPALGSPHGHGLRGGVPARRAGSTTPTRASCTLAGRRPRAATRPTPAPRSPRSMWAPRVGQRRHRRAARPGRHGRAPTSSSSADAQPQARAAARVAAKRLIREHELPMKMSGVDHVVGDAPDHHLLHRAAPRRLPRARARPRRDAERQGRAAPALRARRGAADRRHRLLRARAVLLDVPRRLRAGQRADGQGPGPAARTRCASPARAAG